MTSEVNASGVFFRLATKVPTGIDLRRFGFDVPANRQLDQPSSFVWTRGGQFSI